jgi:hypothetical protein
MDPCSKCLGRRSLEPKRGLRRPPWTRRNRSATRLQTKQVSVLRLLTIEYYLRRIDYHRNIPIATAAGAAQGQSTGQQKLSAFFTPKPKQQPSTAPKKRAAPGSKHSNAPASNKEAAAAPVNVPEQAHFTVYTRIVGRQHQDADQQPPCLGEELLLLRESNNAVDPCAILVRAERCWPPATACNPLLAVLCTAVTAPWQQQHRCRCTSHSTINMSFAGDLVQTVSAGVQPHTCRRQACTWPPACLCSQPPCITARL